MRFALAVGVLLAGGHDVGYSQGHPEDLKPVAHRRLLHDFEDPADRQSWRGWSLDQEVDIGAVSPGFGSDTGLRFHVPRLHWDTAIIGFDPPIRVANTTMIRFKLRVDRSGGYGLNLSNATEEAEYHVAFSVVETGWITVQRCLKNAVCKRFGRPGAARDGLVGDDLSSLQIAYLGNEMLLDDFEIIDVENDAPELPPDEIPFEGDYEPRHYEYLDGVFPGGLLRRIPRTQSGHSASALLVPGEGGGT